MRDYIAKKGYSRHKPALPLYTVAESQAALKQFKEIPRAEPFTISPQFSVRPHDAGHILGSSWLELTITENGKADRWWCSRETWGATGSRF